MPRSSKPGFGGKPGIRAGVWLAVLGLSLVCLLLVVVIPRPDGQLVNETEIAATNKLGGESSDAPAAVFRGIRRHAKPAFASEHDSEVPAPQNAEEAARLACEAANQKAKELYDCEPFGHERPAFVLDGRWIWFDTRGQGNGDLEAKVEFGADGAVQSVDVLLLHSLPDRFLF